VRELNNVRNWASDIEENTRLQAERTARLDILAGPLALMPDAHLGMGATIGSVIPTEGAIIPSAVGVDIGCGMVATETDLKAGDLPDSLNPYMGTVREIIPAGVGKGHEYGPPASVLRWLRNNPRELTQKQAAAASKQLGSLGSGNHFFEVCLDERDRVWLVLHSGSRGVGNQLAQGHIKIARELGKQEGLEDPELMHFTQGTPEFESYIGDMLWAQEYARENRRLMVAAAILAFLEFVGKGAVTRGINCHHNFAQIETHGGQEVWITRKGAVEVQEGQYGIIPGSMGTRSYIVKGRGNPLSYNSCAHGAGRRMSRTAAKKQFTADDLRAHMEGKVWNDRDAERLIDEIPDSYKDIDQVMADQEDLVTVEHTLSQILNFKGQ